MARRNIFDRDTGAGYYSDALGNFLENIPSFYGQIAREKRLERQRIEDTNYRNQTYNNQLLQQSRNNIRQDKIDRQNITWQDFQKEDKKFKNKLQMAELASINNPGAVDSFLLNEGVITQDDFNSRKSINNDYNDLITDVDGYINMTVNEQFEKYHDATDMYNQINTKLTALNPRSPMSKTLRDEKNKLNKALNFIKTKSGQVRPLNEWSNSEDAVLYNQLTEDLKDYNKQLREINSQITKAEASGQKGKILEPMYAMRDALQVATEDSFGKLGYSGSIPKTITDLAMMGAKYKYPSIPDKPLEGQDTGSSGLADTTDDDRDKIIEERTQFLDSVEPLLRDDEAGLDALLDYYRDEGDESFSRLESVANVLKKQIDAEAPKIIGVVPPESKNIVGIEPIPGTEPQVTEPLLAEGVEPEPKPKPKPEPKPKPNIPTVIPTLTANQQAIEDRAKVDPAKILDNVFGKTAKDTEKLIAEENLLQEMDKSEAAKYDIEPYTSNVADDTSSYITYRLDKDLEKLNNLKSRVNQFKGRDDQTSRYNFKKLSKSIKEIENRVKNTIGKYINPISGDISIADEGYKKSVIKRLNKKFGKDLYPLLASLSNVKRI